MNITVRPDRALVRAAGGSERFASVQITAPVSERRTHRGPIDVSFVLDRSGSMGGDKIVLARQAIAHAVALLDERDRFSIVSFDTEVETVAEPASAAADARHVATDRLSRVEPRGGTDLSSGWLRGCELVASHLVDGAQGRVLLATDGLANAGITDADELARHAANLRERGVRTSTFGIGHDYDEVLLGRLADAGGGRYYFIQRAQEIPDRIMSEIGEELEITARGVRLEVQTLGGVTAELLNDLPSSTEHGRLVVHLGDLVSGQQLSLIVRIRFPAGAEAARTLVSFRVSDSHGVSADATVEWTFAGHLANDRQPRATDVDQAVGGVFAARARRDALERNRRGDYDGARRILEGTAQRIATYAGSDPVLDSQRRELLHEAAELQAPLAAAEMKTRHAASYQALRSRDVSGKSRRA